MTGEPLLVNMIKGDKPNNVWSGLKHSRRALCSTREMSWMEYGHPGNFLPDTVQVLVILSCFWTLSHTRDRACVAWFKLPSQTCHPHVHAHLRNGSHLLILPVLIRALRSQGARAQ